MLAEPALDVLLLDLAAAGVSLRVRWWTAPPRRDDALDGRDPVLTAIRLALAREGIDLPFPTQQILFHDQTEPGDAQQREGWPPARTTDR